MSSIYRGFLDKNRLITGVYSSTNENVKTTKIVKPCNTPHFYYEGQCIVRGDNKLIPHGNGTMWSMYDIRSIVSGNFEHGQLEGFMNVTIPEKETEITCNYIQGKPDKKSSFMITRSSEFKIHIK